MTPHPPKYGEHRKHRQASAIYSLEAGSGAVLRSLGWHRWHGVAKHGLAWHSVAWQGRAWQGRVGQGRAVHPEALRSL